MTTVDASAPAHASNVYLFKNGYGMIVKAFEFPPTGDQPVAGLELTDPPAHAVHGTFWIQSRTDKSNADHNERSQTCMFFVVLVSIKSIRTKKIRKNVDRECLTLEDLIEANVGENVQLLTVDPLSNAKEWLHGRLTSVKRTEKTSEDDTETDSSASPPNPVSLLHTLRSRKLLLH